MIICTVIGSPTLQLDLPLSLPATYIGYATQQTFLTTGLGAGINGDGGERGGVQLNLPLTLTLGVGTMSNVLVFTYTVLTTDGTSSLDYASTTSLKNSKRAGDGIFRAYINFPLRDRKVPATLILPPKGSGQSLGRTSDIVINNHNRPYITYVTSNKNIVTAGDSLCILFTYTTNMTIIDTRDNSLLVDSLGNVLLSDASAKVLLTINTSLNQTVTTVTNIPGTTLNTTSTTIVTTTTIKNIYATLTKIIGNMATFCYTVLASDPSGSVQIGNILPFLFLNSSILSSSIKNKDFASPELMTNMLRTVSTVDNNLPYVLTVSSPNVSSLFPFGVGDVIDIYIKLNTPVVHVLNDIPYLRLLLADDIRTYATYVPDTPINPLGSDLIHFKYRVNHGDNAHPLKYDTIYALTGDFKR